MQDDVFQSVELSGDLAASQSISGSAEMAGSSVIDQPILDVTELVDLVDPQLSETPFIDSLAPQDM